MSELDRDERTDEEVRGEGSDEPVKVPRGVLRGMSDVIDERFATEEDLDDALNF